MSGKFGGHKVEINKTNTSSGNNRNQDINAKPLKTVALNEGYNGASEFFQEFNSKKDSKDVESR